MNAILIMYITEALQDPNSIGIELLTQKVKSADRLFERGMLFKHARVTCPLQSRLVSSSWSAGSDP